ncbi:flagellar hook-associated protein FlgL [Thermodesulfitimonas sp.]
MRVTTGMLTNTVLVDLEKHLSLMAKRQEELASGKRLNRPSDDPNGVIAALRIRAHLAEDAQYMKNMGDAISWLNVTDTALRDVVSTLQRLRELAIAGANQVLPPDSLAALAEEVAQLKDHLGNVANTNYGGRYIFGGAKTTTPPYDSVTGSWNGTSDILVYEVAAGVTVPVNIDGQAVFNGTVAPNVFNLCDDLITDLKNNNAADISAKRLAEIDQNIDNILAILAEVGARVNRLEMAQGRLERADIDFSGLLSQIEDTDMARAIMDLKNQENSYRATLSVGARIIQPTLVDFLR